MLRRRGERSLWLLPGMLLCHMLVSMVMVVMDVERRQRSRVYVVVREMVLHHGEARGVVEEVMVLVVVMGPKRRERHRHEVSLGVVASGTGARPAPHALAHPSPAPPAVAHAAHPPAVRNCLADVGVVG